MSVLLFSKSQGDLMNLRKAGAWCLLTALAGAISSAQDRIVEPVDRSQMRALKGHVHPRALADSDQGPVDPAMPIRRASALGTAGGEGCRP